MGRRLVVKIRSHFLQKSVFLAPPVFQGLPTPLPLSLLLSSGSFVLSLFYNSKRRLYSAAIRCSWEKEWRSYHYLKTASWHESTAEVVTEGMPYIFAGLLGLVSCKYSKHFFSGACGQCLLTLSTSPLADCPWYSL